MDFMKINIPYGSQHINNSDINAVSRTLKKKIITGGKSVYLFENEFSRFTGAKFSLTCNSGTSALYLAYKTINLKKGDNIIMPAINFVAAANMAKNLGANIFLSDVDKNSGQITKDKILECVKVNKIKKIKCILIMYLGGHIFHDPIEIYKLKKILNTIIIEDSCHALGAGYLTKKNKKFYIGSCQHSDISVFSLHPLKSITTGEGGVLTTNNKKLYHKASIFRNHGIIRKNHYEYDVVENGFNFRMSDLNASLGISQLKKIKKFINRRKQLANEYIKRLEFLENFSINHYKNKTLKNSSWHLFQVKIRNFTKVNIKLVIKKLLKLGITCQLHYKPIYKFKIYANLKNKKLLKNSDIFYRSNLTIPLFYKLSNSQQKYIIKNLKKI